MKNATAKILALFLIAAGVGLIFLKTKPSSQITLAITTALKPGMQAIDSLESKWKSKAQASTSSNEIESTQLRTLIAQNAVLTEQLKKFQTLEYPSLRVQDTENLFSPGGLRARIIGHQQAKVWNQSVWLNRGESTGIHDSEIVLEVDSTIIDLGETSRIPINAPVLSGQAAVGTIHKTASSISHVRRITDVKYRGAARLLSISKETQQPVLGAVGSLHGTGEPLCKLEYIEEHHPVQVGDFVIATDEKGEFQLTVFYGKVIEAKLNSSQTHWEIVVKPACDFENLKEVVVLNESVTPKKEGVVQR